MQCFQDSYLVNQFWDFIPIIVHSSITVQLHRVKGKCVLQSIYLSVYLSITIMICIPGCCYKCVVSSLNVRFMKSSVSFSPLHETQSSTQRRISSSEMRHIYTCNCISVRVIYCNHIAGSLANVAISANNGNPAWR